MGDLARAVDRLALEFQKDREVAQRDREILALRLENLLLKQDRLPPGGAD